MPLESYPSRTLKYAVLAGLAKRERNYSSFKFLVENLEKFRSTELYGAALEGSRDGAALWAVRQWKAVNYLS